MAKTAMQELIEWIDKEIVLNPYYRASPRLTEGAAIVKTKVTALLEKEKQQRIDDFDAGMSFERNTWKYSIGRNDEIRENYFKQ